MDAPAMFTRKHVPENIAAEEEGGQQQLHRDEKPHKPVLKKVKDKVKKIKNTIAGKGHGNGDEHEHENDTGGSNSSDMDEEDSAMREAEVEKGGYQVEKGGYQEDVEDKRVMDSSPELHGAPMYDSERIAEVKRNDATGDRLGDFGVPAAKKGVERTDDTEVRLGDQLGGPVVEDPMAPNSKTPTPRGGEDIGTTDVVRDFEALAVSDDPKHAGVQKMDRDQIKETEAMPVSDGTGEEWTDAPADAEYTGSYTDRLKNTAAGTTEYGKKLASTVYEKVAGVGTAVATKAQQVTPGFGAGGSAQHDSTTAEPMAVDAGKRDLDQGMPASYAGTDELKNAATDATTEGAPGATTYTDKIKSAAAGTTEYGKQMAGTVYGKVTPVFGAGGNARDDSSTPAVDAGKRDLDLQREGTPASYTGTEQLKNATTDATTEAAPGATTYTDKIKSAAAGTTEYGKQLASTVYEKVTPVFGAGGNARDDSSTPAVDAGKRDLDLQKEGTPASYTGTEQLKNATTDATTEGAPGATTYTDKIKYAAAGTTEYGKQLASTVYEKVAGVGTAVAGKAQQVMPSSAGTATPGVGAQDGSTARTVTPGAGGPGNGQDKGVSGVSGVTTYIADYLRPGDEERSLSEAITGAVQQRKEGVGSTVSKAREVPAQAVTRAREAVTSLTGGNRVSETVQPTTEGNIGEGVAAEVPTLHGEEIGAPRTNTNGL